MNKKQMRRWMLIPLFTASLARLSTAAGLTDGALTGTASEVNLHQLLETAESRSRQYQRQIAEQQLNRPAALAAWGQFLPAVQVGYSADQSSFYNPTYLNPDGSVATYPRWDTLQVGGLDTVIYYSVPQGKRRNSGLYLRVEEVLFDGGNNYFNLRNTQLQSDLRRDRLLGEQCQLRAQVRQAYAQTLAADRQMELAGKVVQQRRLQLAMASVRFETGSVTRRDVLQAEVDLGRAVSDSLTAALNLQRLKASLNLTVGLPLDTTLNLAPLPAIGNVDWNEEQLIQTALSEGADIRGSEVTLGIRRNSLLAAKGGHLPVLSAYLTHNRTEQSGANVGFTFEPRNRFTSVGLNFSWQLFNRFANNLRQQDAEIKRRQAELDHKELSETITYRIRTAVDRLLSLQQQAQVAVQNSLLAEQTLAFEQERYRLGSGTILELGAAQLSFIQAQSDQIRIETEYHTAIGELELAVGVPLLD
jgi:outer membrane protein